MPSRCHLAARLISASSVRGALGFRPACGHVRLCSYSMFVLLGFAASTVPTGARLEAGLLQAEPVAKERSLRGGMAKRWPILARRVDLSHGERYTSTDWLTNFLSIPRSHVLERIGPHLWSQTGLCALVVLLHRHGLRFPTGSAMPHTLLGGFLSLLLAFRTNMAYNRFYAGRLNWGVVKNSCSDLALYAVTHVRPRSPALAERLLALVASFPPALACRCCCDESSAKLPLSQRQALSGAMETAAPSAALALCLKLRRRQTLEAARLPPRLAREACALLTGTRSLTSRGAAGLSRTRAPPPPSSRRRSRRRC